MKIAEIHRLTPFPAPETFSSSEMNLYRYCGDDPVDMGDPTGLYFVIVGSKDYRQGVIEALREEGAKNEDVKNAIAEMAKSDNPHVIQHADSMFNSNPFDTAGPGHKAPRTDAYYGKMDMFSKSWWHSWTDTK